MSGTGVASYGDLLLTSLVVLACVCVAAFVVVRLFGRFLATGRSRGAHLLDVVARVPLEPRRSLYVVEVAGKTLLVGTSEMGLSVLSELDGNEVRARTVERLSFGELVKQAWARRKERAAATASTSTSSPTSTSTPAPTARSTSTSTLTSAPTASTSTGDKGAGNQVGRNEPPVMTSANRHVGDRGVDDRGVDDRGVDDRGVDDRDVDDREVDDRGVDTRKPGVS